MRRTIDLPDELDRLVSEEKLKSVHNGNASSVVRTALVYFFDRQHTPTCERGREVSALAGLTGLPDTELVQLRDALLSVEADAESGKES